MGIVRDRGGRVERESRNGVIFSDSSSIRINKVGVRARVPPWTSLWQAGGYAPKLTIVRE